MVKEILAKVVDIFLNSDNRYEIKTLLHLLISKITINELRECDSIGNQLN